MKGLLAFCVYLALAGGVGATTVKPFVFDEICQTARTIAHVRCVEANGVVLPGRDGVFTRYRFDVLSVIKGSASEHLVLVLPGGAVVGQRTEVPGMPRFTEGAETVLFLTGPDDYGSPWPVGLGQGCYGVESSEEGERQVHFHTGAAPVPPGVRAKPVARVRMPLPDFLSAVRSILQEEAPGGDTQR